MHAVSCSDSRFDGLTSVDSVTGINFGKFTLKLTARGHNWTTNWLSGTESVRDCPPYYPPASGHGHRP